MEGGKGGREVERGGEVGEGREGERAGVRLLLCNLIWVSEGAMACLSLQARVSVILAVRLSIC